MQSYRLHFTSQSIALRGKSVLCFYAAELCVTSRLPPKNVGHLPPAGFTDHPNGHWRYLQQNCDIFLLTLMRGVTEKRDRFHAINWFFSNGPLYKITKLSTSGAYWIIHLLLCLSLPFVQSFLSLLPDFWMRIDGPILSFSLPCFPGFAFVPRTPHFRKAPMEGRFCSWTSSSSLKKKIGSVFFEEKKGGFYELLSKPHSIMFDHRKGPTFMSFGCCAFFTPWARKTVKH